MADPAANLPTPDIADFCPCLDLHKLFADLQSPAILQERKIALVKAAGKTCLHFFLDFFIGYPDIANRFHADGISRIEEERDKDLFLWPRGHLKTSVFTIGGSLWSVVRNPNRRIGIGSDTLGRAKGFLREIKLLAEGKRALQVYYPEVFYLDPPNQSPKWTDEELQFKRTAVYKEATITAFGLEALPTGDHYEDIRLDDIVTPENTTTRDQMDHLKKSFALLTPILEPKGACMRVSGTRYDYGDKYSELQTDPAWRLFREPAEGGPNGLIFPQKFSLARLAEIRREVGPYIYSCQYLLDPIDPETAMFRRSWIQYFDTWRPGPYRAYITVDQAYSMKKEADYTVVMQCRVDRDKNLYVADYIRGHIGMGDVVKAVFAIVERTPSLSAVGIEIQPNETETNSAMILMLREEMRRRGQFFNLKPIRPARDKVARASILVPLFSNGQVYIRSNMTELEDELLRFPRGEHDDLVDALAYVPHIWTETRIQRVPEPEVTSSIGW